jgi:transposase-like protein
MSGGRGIPFHCPYCGDENLRPSEEGSAGGGSGGGAAWECHACLRAFKLSMIGMIPRPSVPSTSTEVPR